MPYVRLKKGLKAYLNKDKMLEQLVPPLLKSNPFVNTLRDHLKKFEENFLALEEEYHKYHSDFYTLEALLRETFKETQTDIENSINLSNTIKESYKKFILNKLGTVKAQFDLSIHSLMIDNQIPIKTIGFHLPNTNPEIKPKSPVNESSDHESTDDHSSNNKDNYSWDDVFLNSPLKVSAMSFLNENKTPSPLSTPPNAVTKKPSEELDDVFDDDFNPFFSL